MRRWLAVSVFALSALPAPAANAQDEADAGVWIALAAAGATATVGVIDIASAGASARKYNTMTVSLQPLADPAFRRVGLRLTVNAPWNRGAAPPSARGAVWRGDSRIGTASPKSASKATLWSVGATLIPTGVGIAIASAGGWNDNQGSLGAGLGLVGAGWVFGPSAGHWYAERHGRGWLTVGARVGIALLGFLALSTAELD